MDPENSLIQEIQALRKERNAIILAHNYQPGPIQDLADLTGDSLELSRKAQETDADVIVFCGVHFMAETAAILNPDKIVLLPNPAAGCPMADMITAQDVRRLRQEFPSVPIVTYVNSSAEVKAESTVCCTSANVNRVVASFSDADTLYLIPDQNLAKYAARHTQKTLHYWKGYCPVHHGLSASMVLKAKAAHPDALFLAHPECRPEVLDLADVVTSTSGMLRYVRNDAHNAFLIGTETGILHPMRRDNPHKSFYPVSARMVCPDMKKTSLKDVLRSLKTLTPQVRVAEEIRLKALQAVERMLEI
ncbi:quinolinate synthase NadA [Desulfosoma caldarium]|uniref:Quinolinate synthase n=1 Tax=Desulfosoma caldarium TaxID=610254 RepID=A0A3N1UVJ0_9BACT|nr:quinolinate synthase NadA [Desulfosoma caldarium]ROQ91176.1 quinolinate synthetase [Desulfosoma caldarium]